MERENSLIEENKLLQGKLDEAQTQLQVMTEEPCLIQWRVNALHSLPHALLEGPDK